MIKEPKAKPLKAVIGILLHGQTLQRSIAKIFNPAIFSKDEIVDLNIDEIKQQIFDDIKEISDQIEILKSELAKV